VLNLITVVGQNTHLLPHMLKHYEDKVDKVYVVVYRQDTTDGILEEIEELNIKPFWVVTDKKYHWQRVTDIYNTVRAKKPNDWWIISDDDELQAYPTDIEDIVKSCERQGKSFVTGGFLDRIGKDGIFPKVDRETNIYETFPLGGFFRYPMSGACPNKVTLAKGDQKITSGQHYALFENNKNSWGTEHPKRLPVEECFTQVHHFKWDSTCIDRIKQVADNNKDYSYSEEYKTMYDAIKNSDWKINIKKSDFLVEKLKETSYINYNDYSNWNYLTKLIIKI
tara:strand:+ start:1904 stop:2743 length:840 start_codon:yes stop_codon:yes gene_type:complete